MQSHAKRTGLAASNSRKPTTSASMLRLMDSGLHWLRKARISGSSALLRIAQRFCDAILTITHSAAPPTLQSADPPCYSTQRGEVITQNTKVSGPKNRTYSSFWSLILSYLVLGPSGEGKNLVLQNSTGRGHVAECGKEDARPAAGVGIEGAEHTNLQNHTVQFSAVLLTAAKNVVL